MSSSGMVIAGFGDLDLYPGYHEYSCYGFLLDDFAFEEASTASVSVNVPSHIKPFATTAMVETFILGFSEDVYSQVANQYKNTFAKYLRRSKNELGIPDIGHADQIVESSATEYQEAWTNGVAENHFKPLREVVASLPVDEMASLASTLVMLQSLKEKVTSPSESVGGPIDVAIITKHEGLIWISRKHYFDPDKNPRYFVRQRAKYGA